MLTYGRTLIVKKSFLNIQNLYIKRIYIHRFVETPFDCHALNLKENQNMILTTYQTTIDQIQNKLIQI